MKITVSQLMQLNEDAQLLYQHVDQEVKALTTPEERSALLPVVSAAHRIKQLSDLLTKTEVTIKG